jgi:hypothetical protein
MPGLVCDVVEVLDGCEKAKEGVDCEVRARAGS